MLTETLPAALVERLQRRHALANDKRAAKKLPPYAFGDFVAELCGYALDLLDARDREKGWAQTPTIAPAPAVVSLTVTEQAPPAPTPVAAVAPALTMAAPALWGEMVFRVKVSMGSDASVLGQCTPARCEGRALHLYVPTPFLAHDLQQRIGGWFSRVATQVVNDGHLVEVAFRSDPAYFERTAQAEARAETREAERALEDFERNKRAAHLVTLYAKRDVESAKEAGRLLVTEPDLIDMIPAVSRKLITQWALSTTAGADHQTGKEAAYRGPRKPQRQARGGDHES